MNTEQEFWNWTRESLSFGLRAQNWYNNKEPYGLPGYINDYHSRMIGYANLRQLRVNQGKFFESIKLKI